MITITDRYFIYPPHIATTWDFVISMHSNPMPQAQLEVHVQMRSGLQISLPPIDLATCQRLFDAFQKFQERRQSIKLRLRSIDSSAPNSPDESELSSETVQTALTLIQPPSSTRVPLQGLIQGISPTSSQQPTSEPSSQSQSQTGGIVNFEQFARNLRHNPEMSNLPILPKELLAKIAHTTRLMFAGEELVQVPQPQPGCHCLYCQIARAMQGGMEQSAELVSEADIHLCQWLVRGSDEEHYIVASSSDPSLEHEVRLKPNISCSCGVQGCEHIKAVLLS